jgi:hypothetical protein
MVVELFRSPRSSKRFGLYQPYQVNCIWCGVPNAGVRARKPLQVRCFGCKRLLYIGPLSPLHGVAGLHYPASPPATDQPMVPPDELKWSWRLWAPPIITAVVTLVVVTIVLLVLFGDSGGGLDRSQKSAGSASELLAEGERKLGEGAYHLALQALLQAQQAQRQTPLPASQSKQLDQLIKQVELITLLSEQSLQQILHSSLGLPADEWRRTFDQRYAGTTILFDGFVRREADGDYSLKLPLTVGTSRAKLDLRSLRVLRDLPLTRGTRLLFGAKLTNIREDPPYQVVQFDPASGVLITHEIVLVGTSILVDDELRQVIRQQAKWLGVE